MADQLTLFKIDSKSYLNTWVQQEIHLHKQIKQKKNIGK